MDPSLRSRILTRLSDEIAGYPPRQQRVAKYVIDHPEAFGLDPVRVTADRIGVSTYTLVRVAERLGFRTFDEMRAPFRHALTEIARQTAGPDWASRFGTDTELGSVMARAAANASALVETTLSRIDPQKFSAAVDDLLAARRVYVTAIRSSYAPAFYLNYVGQMALPALRLIPQHMGSAIEDLLGAGPGDLLVAITVTPYSRETVKAAQVAKARGLKLILLTDSEMVAPDLKTDHVLVAATLSTHHMACLSGMTALIDTLLGCLVHRGGEAARTRIAEYEDLRNEHSAYWVRR